MRTLHLLNLLWVLLLGIFIPEKRVSAEVLEDSLETNQSNLQRLWVDSVFDALSFEERLGSSLWWRPTPTKINGMWIRSVH